MDQIMIKKICKNIYRNHPEFANVQPKVSLQTPGKYLLLFKKKVNLPNGSETIHTLRVVGTDSGDILKTSSSRS